MGNVCVLCHKSVPNKKETALIKDGYAKMDFVKFSCIKNPEPTKTFYFCQNHTSKEKADAIWTLMNHGEPYKFNRFEHIID
jgi:hypothetical protein